MDGNYLKNNAWPTEKTIHTIDAKGILGGSAPLVAIEKLTDDNAVLGQAAIKKQDWQGAIIHFQKELQNFPSNEIAWSGLSNAYLNLGQLDKAKEAIDKTLSIEPHQLQSLNFLGMYHLRKNDLTAAKQAFLNSVDIQPKNAFGYYYLGIIDQKTNAQQAIAYAKQALAVNSRFKPAYELIAKISESMGDNKTAQAYRNAAAKIGK